MGKGSEAPSSGEELLYPIGVVARRTGLSVNTIRTWERRYRAVEPRRDGSGRRAYTEADVDRLRVLRALSRHGESVRHLAAASLETLRAKLSSYEPDEDAASVELSSRLHQPTPTERSRMGVALLHPHLESVFAGFGRPFPWQVVHRGPDVERFCQTYPASAEHVEVLIVDLALLGPNPEETLERLLLVSGASRSLVTYDFAVEAVLRRLRGRGVRLHRGPLEPSSIDAQIADMLAEDVPVPDVSDGDEPVPPRRYDDLELARLRGITTDFECECPHHLATVVAQLVAFETYSARCARDNPEDAAVHDALYQGTALARRRLEELLQLVCDHDGIVTNPLS